MGDYEHIPTMPQAPAESGHIPTMPQASLESGHIPTMPQASVSEDGHIATMPQAPVSENGHVATMPQGGQRTGGVNGSRLLEADTPFVDEAGTEYIILSADPISVDTGEARIYHCKYADGTGDLVAKIHISLRPNAPAKKLITRKKIIEFLEKYSNNPDSYILPLVGHGLLELSGESYFVDVYPFCSGGALSSGRFIFSLDQLRKDVIYSVNEAINTFHKENLVHRDLKPDNLYYYNGRVVIGDFGITCELNSENYAVDNEMMGTLGYLAPELMSRAAIIQSDYYAFGQTLWTLYHGEMMYWEAIKVNGGFMSEDARNTVTHLMLSNDYPGLDEIDRKDEFFEVLIRGLLNFDPNRRFGYEEVRRWLDGDKSLYQSVDTFRSDEIFEKTIRINEKDCIDNEEVVKQLCSAWDKSIDVLFSGDLHQYYKFLLRREDEATALKRITDYVAGLDEKDENKLRIQKEVGLTRAILFLSKKKCFCWRGKVYASPQQISDEMSKLNAQNGNKEDFYTLVSTDLLYEWLSTVGVEKEEVLEECKKMSEFARSSSMGARVAYYWMGYMFTPDRSENSYDGCKTLDDIAIRLMAGASDLYRVENMLCCVEDPRLLGYLCSIGYDGAAALFVTDAAIDYKKHYEMLFDMFDNNITDTRVKQYMRNGYTVFGPCAYLTWWKYNLSIYEFNGKNAEKLRQNIDDLYIDSNDSIVRQRAAFAQLEQYYRVFKEYFKVNYLVGVTGVRRSVGKDCVCCDHLIGMLGYKFLDQDAPIGFKYSLKI